MVKFYVYITGTVFFLYEINCTMTEYYFMELRSRLEVIVLVIVVVVDILVLVLIIDFVFI